MKVLITSSRMPFALGMVRQLADAGHEVYAADDYAQSPGSHSKYLAGHFVYPSPRGETEAFIDALERIIAEARDRRHRPRLRGGLLHLDPARAAVERGDDLRRPFSTPWRACTTRRPSSSWSADLGLPIPETVVATSDAELAEAIERFDRYFGRAVFSRGGVDLLTNTGPARGRAGARADVHPTPQLSRG